MSTENGRKTLGSRNSLKGVEGVLSSATPIALTTTTGNSLKGVEGISIPTGLEEAVNRLKLKLPKGSRRKRLGVMLMQSPGAPLMKLPKGSRRRVLTQTPTPNDRHPTGNSLKGVEGGAGYFRVPGLLARDD